MVNILVMVTVSCKVNVSFSTVSDAPLTDVLLDEPDQGVMVTMVVRAFNKEVVVGVPLYSTKNPLPFHSSASAILAFSKDTLIYFHHHSRSPNYCLSVG